MMSTMLAEPVRRFNRFYTRRIGVLKEGLLDSPFSLAEANVLYELAHGDAPAASILAKELSLDAGYLSRILRGLESRALIARVPSPADGRQQLVTLTAAGREAFALLNGRSSAQVETMLEPLSPRERTELIGAMRTIEALLSAPRDERVSFILRPHQPGDIGWIIGRHGALYATEYGWNIEFEAFVAEIAAKFVRDFDPQRECCWIAERSGEIAGSVFVVKHSDEVAQLRMLVVDPAARGLGIGARLVEECIAFAKRAGYKEMMLWTTDFNQAARRIYERAGFTLVSEKRDRGYGVDFVAETWTLELR
jgi:DNA-binding MarR family transcriptional regulator/predicted N-acetyltransferase YhbS